MEAFTFIYVCVDDSSQTVLEHHMYVHVHIHVPDKSTHISIPE